MGWPARDQWLLDAQSIALDIAEGNGEESLKDRNRFSEITREASLGFSSIHDVLAVCDAIDLESNRRGKLNLKRIGSMLTRLMHRTETVSERSVEYEYCDAECECEKTPEPSDATEFAVMPRLL